MKNNLCIDITGKKSGGGDLFVSQLIFNLKHFLEAYNKVIIFYKDNIEKVDNNNKIYYIQIPTLFRNKYLLFIWQNFIIDLYLKKFSCKTFLSMNSIYIGNFKSFVVIHQNSLPFTNNEIKKYKNYFFKFKLKIQRNLLIKTYTNASLTIFLTEYSKNLVYNFLKKKIKFKIIPLAVQDYFNRHPNKNLKLDKKYNSLSKINILYVSSLHLYKNHINLLKSINLLIKDYPNIKLTLIGERINFLKKEIYNQFKNYSLKNLEYIENVDNIKLNKYHFESDIFIFPSTCETFPLSLLEAMKSSLPVLVSNYIKTIKVVNEDVLTFNPHDPIDISQKIKLIIDNKNLRKKIVNKSYKFVNDYNWKDTLIEIGDALKNT